ncbi:winged helix-turn-helix domain-containing protein [Saccharopolyspora sp. NPDC000995]
MPKLSDDQVAEVADALTQGPRAAGFGTGMWTLARVAEEIEQVTGVRYSTTQTWTILRERLGWSRQRRPMEMLWGNVKAVDCWVFGDAANGTYLAKPPGPASSGTLPSAIPAPAGRCASAGSPGRSA